MAVITRKEVITEVINLELSSKELAIINCALGNTPISKIQETAKRLGLVNPTREDVLNLYEEVRKSALKWGLETRGF